MAFTELKNAQSDVLLTEMAQGATTGTLTGGNFGTPSGDIYLTFDYDVASKYEVKKCTVAGSSLTNCTHVSGANVAHSAGSKVGRMINAEVVDEITTVVDDHETRMDTAEADITALETTTNTGAWITGDSMAFGAADAPTFTATITGDKTSKYYSGVRVKLDQTQALSHYWTFNTNSAADKGTATMADIGTPTYTAGKFGNALTLNGSNQALSITDATAFKPTGEFTLGVWFKTSNAGQQMIFQSFAYSTNQAGIHLQKTAAGPLAFQTANNTGGSTTSYIQGTTSVADGNWHYAVVSFRNNYCQLYVDGKLDASGYMMTPAYQATNYVRIGCYNTTGSNSLWFNGQIDDLFLINGYALDEKYIAAKYAATTAQGTSDLTLTKYFLTSIDSTYSNPSTTVTLYGGTDYTLSNSAITNVYYSPQKAPYGFPLNPAKWTVTAAISTDQTQSSPTSGTWYNLGGSISVPIGMWEKRYSILGLATKTTMSGQIQATLSRANNTASNPEMSASSYIDAISAAFGAQLIATGNESFSAKTTLYLNLKTVITSATSLINYAGTGVPSIVTVRSTLL